MRVGCLYFHHEVNLHQVADIFLRLSPQIALGKSALFIEIEKCRRLYSEDGFRARCHVLLKRLGLEASLAVGNDISESFVMAKYGVHDIDVLPLDALVDLADPLEKDVVLQENIQKMLRVFTHLGINHIAQFRLIPLSDLVSRFGAISVLCMQKLRKEITTPWIYWRPTEVIFEKDHFPYFEFYGELEPLLFKLKEQLDRIFHRLWARHLHVQKLQVRIFCETNSVHSAPYRNFEFDFVTPQSTTKATLNILKERLAKDFEKNPVMTPIEALETKVLIAVPGKTAQKNLLHKHDEQREQMHALLGQLIEAHGKKNIFHAELTEDRRPEKSWRKLEPHLAISTTADAQVTRRIPRRPTRLLSVPMKVHINGDIILIQSKRFKILHTSVFIERITGDWFENTESLKKSYERNYIELELEEGPTVSVFKTPDEQFYLHGFFG